MANKDNNNSEKDFFIPHKNNSSGLSFLHQQQNMELSPAKTVDASTTSSPPQASSTVDTPISPSSSQQFVAHSQAMTSSDKMMVSSPHDTGGSQFRSSHQTTQQNSNSSVHHNTTNIINNNNNNSQNTENHNNDALRKTSRNQENQEEDSRVKAHLVTPDNEHMLSKKSPSHESHFSGGSGVLVDDTPTRPARRQYVNKNQTSDLWYTYEKNAYENGNSSFNEDAVVEGRTELNNMLKEREDRVKRVRHEQEAERLKKADEWKQQALAAHKFREQQEYERKRALEEARNREIAKQNQIKERREKIIVAERERREELLKRNLAREERLEQRRKSQVGQIHFGFGSSTPRMIEPRTGEDGCRRSTSSSNVHGQLMTQSMYVPSRRSAERDPIDDTGRFSSASGTRPSVSASERSNKRSTSVYGIDKSGKEGNEGDDLMTQSFHAGATPSHTRVHPNRRRTDITPTVTASAMGTGMGQPLSSREISRASTPGRRMMMSTSNGKPPGKAVSMSRLDQLARPRVLNLNDSKNAYPSESSPSHAPLSLTNNARLSNRRSKIGQTSSKNFSASMSQLNGPSTGTFAPKVGHRARPPLSSSSSTRTRPRTGGKDDEGMSREGTVRSPSAMSNASNTGVQVRLRQPGIQRKPRPTSIAVSGMSQSMYDKRNPSAASTPSSFRGPPRLNTPETRKKGPGSVGRGGVDDPNEDARSNCSSSSSKAHVRRTPAQVKAADAKKPKPIKSPMSSSLHVASNTSTPNKKASVISNNKPNCNIPEGDEKAKDGPQSDPEAKLGINTSDQSDDDTKKMPKREVTPDIISGAVIQKNKDEMEPQVMIEDEETSSMQQNEIKASDTKDAHNTSANDAKKEKTPEETTDIERKEDTKDDDHPSHEHTPSKQIITSEEEAKEITKAKIAKKRKEMKEKMEQEAELERQRQAEIERLEEEKRIKEEEEDRKAMEEAEMLAGEARKAEEERLQKAIEEAQKRESEERSKREEEDRIKRESEQKAKEDAERKQAELEEKLKKEEEERLARKKRIEEIMARTRGGTKASTASPSDTPKKETSPGNTPQESLNNKEDDHDMKTNVTIDSNVTDLLTNNVNNNGPTEVSKENSEEPASFTANGISNLPRANGQNVNGILVNNGPPDLLGDISNNQKQTVCLSKEDDNLLIDTQKSHDVNHQEEKLMNEKNTSNSFPQQQQPLLDFGNDFDPFGPLISNNASVGSTLGNDQPVFDQIIDLSNETKGSMTISKNTHNLNPTDNISGGKEENSVIGAPIIAFEESITASTKSDVPSTADLLS